MNPFYQSMVSAHGPRWEHAPPGAPTSSGEPGVSTQAQSAFPYLGPYAYGGGWPAPQMLMPLGPSQQTVSFPAGHHFMVRCDLLLSPSPPGSPRHLTCQLLTRTFALLKCMLNHACSPRTACLGTRHCLCQATLRLQHPELRRSELRSNLGKIEM